MCKQCSYNAFATSPTPGLVIYLIDVSDSMSWDMNHQKIPPASPPSKIQIVARTLDRMITEMVHRATVGTEIKDRYKIALLGYSDDVYDILEGVHFISEVGEPPILKTFAMTDTALGFEAVKELLEQEISNLPAGSPAPLVCHLTDGAYTGNDPAPVVKQIMNMPSTPDGHVLVENIYFNNNVQKSPIGTLSTWEGITANTTLVDNYAAKLREMSSPLPPSYQRVLNDHGYNLSEDAILMLPGTSEELVSLGIMMSHISDPTSINSALEKHN
jgi:hypothetical protein